MYVTLKCEECDNVSCNLYKTRKTHGVGCTRKVTEEQQIKYVHYMTEVLPFMHMLDKAAEKRQYNEIICFLNEIYNCPVGRKVRFKKDGTPGRS